MLVRIQFQYVYFVLNLQREVEFAEEFMVVPLSHDVVFRVQRDGVRRGSIFATPMELFR
jgi:hypothetical protein